MHASIIVLSALVAVASAQWSPYWGGMMPINPALGVPFDEPLVREGKIFNAHQHAIRGGFAGVVRKRREAAAPEAPAAAAADAAEAPEAQPEKRQILAYSGLGYTGLGYAGLGYGGWSTPYLGYGYGAYPYGIYRKRRDVSEESPATETSTGESESEKEKRQLGYFGYGYGGLYSPYMRSMGGIYGGYPYLFRKRRDTSETESPEQAPAMGDEQAREKRQYFGLGYGWGYPSMYSGIYSPFGRSHMVWRKRRDTDSQTAPAAEDNSEESRNKRQFMYASPYAYSAAYTPYMMGYSGWHGGLGYRRWY